MKWATKKGKQFKTYELFIAAIFHWMFSDHGNRKYLKPWIRRDFCVLVEELPAQELHAPHI